MASRKLTVEFIGDTNSLDRAFKKVEGGSRGAGKNLAGVAKGAGLAGAALGGALLVGATKAVGAFYESQKVGKQTNAVLKSTGGAANVTAKQVGDLATAISQKTGMDDEAIQSGENLLLTFTKVRNETGKGNDVFNQATQTITDMSAALGQDMKSSAIQLGKALNDPIKGITALQRVGVSFTASQKEQIKGLVEHGKTLEAQKLILKELNTEFGGSAAATATNMDRLKVTLGNLQESIGSVFVPVLEKVSAGLNSFVNGMMSGTGAGGRLVQVLKDIGQWLSGAFTDAVKGAGAWLHQHRDDLNAVADAGRNVATTLKWVWETVVFPIVQRVLPAIQQIVEGVFKAIGGAVDVLVGILTLDFGRAWDGVKAIFEGGLEGALGVLRAATAPVREAVAVFGGILGDAIKGLASDLANAGKWILEQILGGFKAVTTGITEAAGWLKDQTVTAVQGVANGFTGLGKWMLGTVTDGFQALPKPVKDAAGWLKNRVVESVHDEVEGFKAVGGWILGRLMDGFKVVTDALSNVGGWLKNRISESISAAIDGFKSLGATVLNLIVDGLKVIPAAGEGILSVGGWVKNRIGDSLEAIKADITGIGGTIIDRITDGIKGAGKAIEDAAKWLKDELVKAVKKFFGISSPSKVMMELGGHMAMGIVKGFSSVDIGGMIKGTFGGMRNLAGDLLGGKALGGVGLGGVFGKDQLSEWLSAALLFTNHFSAANLKALYGRAMQESGGNPKAINLWDINAKMGHPSKGLLQTIDSTFDAYKAPGHGNIWNPVDNAIAAINYMFARYGHIVGPSSTGYAAGTDSAARGWAWVGERGPELVRFKGGETVLSHQDSMSKGANVTIEYADMRTTTNAQVFANKLAFRLA